MPDFYDNPERQKGIPTERIKIELGLLQKQLEGAKEKEQRGQIRDQILTLKRELNRTDKFKAISNNKLAEGKNSLDTISATDLMKIDKESGLRRGELLSKSFLYKRAIDSEGAIFEEPSDGKNLKESDMLMVDFGKNKSANDKIGAGQMLDTSISHIKVNGKLGVRSIINNRVGYYTKNEAGGYIPVFSGDIIEIPSKKEIAEFDGKPENLEIKKNTEQKDSDEANDRYIGKLESMPGIATIEVNANTRESYDFWISKGFSHEQASGLVANEYRESNCNPKAVGDSGASKGIFQWSVIRRDIIKKGSGIDIDTASHSDQLKAAYWEMTETSESRVMKPLKEAKTAYEAAGIFSKIYENPANEDKEMDIRGEMAEAFAIMLDPNGRSTNLGDHVVQRGPAKLGPDSCGAAVRELLKSYGITGLPETGANGKNWEDILNERPSQFVKMKIGHPDQAYPGAILVYDGSGSEGSLMNKKHGHVEIKGSDGKYYSYYNSSRAGGSAAVSEKDPKKYEDLTGFIGYAYYPKNRKI